MKKHSGRRYETAEKTRAGIGDHQYHSPTPRRSDMAGFRDEGFDSKGTAPDSGEPNRWQEETRENKWRQETRGEDQNRQSKISFSKPRTNSLKCETRRISCALNWK